ncbi:uncharacterized protein LOC105193936 [Solenopsis invicta]|uniref:uncharacterized protein LOC105193936 n=1 Tax=Solenopsis invicta TaxID=13686 RepID=UPI00193E3185|nr:uncharacterized protein LOC105193936 [Solenopsis invicta]
MKILRKHLLLCTLITLLSGNVADKSLFHDDILMQNGAVSPNDDSIDYRLPTNVKPTLYEIMLVPYLKEGNFTGIEKIEVTVMKETDTITLHVGNIEIESVTVVKLPNKEFINGTLNEKDSITEKYNIKVPDILIQGTQLVISFTYKGILSDNMIGFYRSSYIEQGEIKWLAATQFHATHARHAFPCFDEPSFKAKFKISIARDEDFGTLSNMPLESSEQLKLGSKIWDVYGQSLEMSTYLVAFVVSQFKFLKNSTPSLDFKAWSKPSTYKQADYALTTGVKILQHFATKFESEYQLPKMDMVAVPDFAAGAMENWGLVTYRESRMLYDEKESSAAAQQSVASVVAHELSHMWFGNLVTPEWWSYMWLSEGFATYFQYFGTAQIESSWDMDKQFVVEQHQTALIADGLETSLPMSREVKNKEQIAGAGDTITYNKGASIIRMMSHLLGDKIFEESLKLYLKNNKDEGLGNPDKLWNAVQEANKDSVLKELNIKKIMESWTKKAGYPVVSIAVNNDGTMNVTQERFLLRNLEETPQDITWSIPLTYGQKKSDLDNVIFKYLLETNEVTINQKVNIEQWIIFNVRSSGFYRVNYDLPGWQKILSVLKEGNITDINVLNRASIIDDLLNLGRAGYLNYDIILDGLLYLKRERDYLPFKAAFNGLEYLNRRFSGHAEHTLFKTYVLSLLGNVNSQLGYEEPTTEDNRLNTLLRREMNNWLCNFNDEECINIFKTKFDVWRKDKKKRINPNERPIAYCTAIRHGTTEDWNDLWKEYSESIYVADQAMILNALGCSNDTNIIEKYLKAAISSYIDGGIRKQDSTSVFAAVYNSGLYGAEFVLDFVDKYHKEMEEYYGGQATIATILDGASQHLSTIESVNKFKKLIEDHKADFKSIQESLDYSLKVAQYELNWYTKFSTSIIQWLKEREKLTYRLPLNIIPESYNISLTPYLCGDFHFDGKVAIKAKVKEPTSQIILHSSNIEYKDEHKLKVVKKVGCIQEEVTILKKEVLKQFDFFVIYLKEELSVGTNLIIEIEYTGSLNTPDLRGFYRSSYMDEKGQQKWLAASHLEPVGARKMFPCFDEPALKAVFTIQVNVPTDYGRYEVISNMEWKSIKKSDDRRYVSYTFFVSEPMSTYLVSVIVSDFKSESIKINGTELAVYARPNTFNQSDYALDIMYPLVKFFETVYKQEYQLSKLFMVALPDFSSKAMENWGLLTYRETNMLYDEKHSSIINKQNIRNVIAHEISHQWFGNLVSPEWWKYLWLKEGFARYFEYHAPARVFDDKTIESQFVVDQVHSAFGVDSSKSTHPMTYDVTTPCEIQSIFDTINYAKAGSILRMVQKTYGTDVFDTALSDYLDKRKYSIATPEHLYESLQQKLNESGLRDDIKAILDTWTTKPGYPVVSVNVSKDSIYLKQKRFFLKDHENNSDQTIWHIPITWASIQNSSNYFDTTPKLWLTKNETIINNPSDSLLIFNTQQSGYYRVNYNKEYWMKLIDYLKKQDIQLIHEINRAALIDDLMNLGRADYIDYNIVITATMYLAKEDNYFPWRAFFNNLDYLNKRFTGRDIEGLYKKWLTSLIGQLYARIGFEDHENDDNLTKILRMHTRKWACKLNIANCTFNAEKYFREKHSGTIIPPNYRDAVYCTIMRMDKTNNSYEYLWSEYIQSNVDTDKLVILNSLACSEKKDILEQLIWDAIKENSEIRYQDSAKVISNIYDASLIGVEVVMKMIETHYDRILRRHFNDYTRIASIVSALASRLSTYDLYNQYKRLLNRLVQKEPEFMKSVESYLTTAEYEFDWYERKMPIIFAALDSLFSSSTYRLPKTLVPKLYNVYLTPHMNEGVFEGKVEIHMTVRENTTLIAFNSHKLDILNIKILRNGAAMQVQSFTTHVPQQLKIYLPNYVYKYDKIIAEIHFIGILNDNMTGFYRSSYFDSNGVQHWLAATHFEPTYARQAFPCFDEPAFKSKFTINIQRPNHYNSLSNMPRKTTVKNPENDKYTWDMFYTSNVAMSTYLVAFVVSEFQSVDDPKNATLNVWGRPEVAAYGKYAQNIGREVVKKLQDITALDYPLLKLDLAGIPDFSMGAMENWGLTTFREYGLFYDEKEATSTYEKYLITVIAHELTHMWFGNLVTCDWWDYIWLNEGFAQYFQWFISDLIQPEYKFIDQFVVYELHPALSKDASISTHPMTNPVRTPEEIANIFDYVTYGKSASVLRMMFNVFDRETCLLALRDYLRKRMYLTARPTDLWESFESFASIPVGNKTTSVEEVMNTWTNQSGYPVVNATLTDNILTLTQERFLINKTTTYDEFYWIPIDIFVPSNSFSDVSLEHKVWLGPEPQRVYINSTDNWFIVNYKQTGFYRVNYDFSSWKALINKLNNGFEDINVLNRAQILDDLFNLARANYVEYELLLNATIYLRQETNHLPWRAFFNGLSYIYERFDRLNFQDYLIEYILNLSANMYNKVGFDDRYDDNHLDKLNREMILQWACKLNKTECFYKSVDLFAAWRKNSSERIPPNARSAVYCTAIREGSTDDWNFLWNQYLKVNFASEKKIITTALGCSTNDTVLRNYLEKAIKQYNPANVTIRRQDISAVFTSVYSASPLGVNVFLQFLITNTEALYQYFERWNEVADLFVDVASHIAHEDHYNDLVYFVQHNINLYPPIMRQKLLSAITIAENNLLWYKNNGYRIGQWVANEMQKKTVLQNH